MNFLIDASGGMVRIGVVRRIKMVRIGIVRRKLAIYVNEVQVS